MGTKLNNIITSLVLCPDLLAISVLRVARSNLRAPSQAKSWLKRAVSDQKP